jgi:hypothetical protein
LRDGSEAISPLFRTDPVFYARPQDFLDAGPSRVYRSISSAWKDRREALFPGFASLLLAGHAVAGRRGEERARLAKRLGFLLVVIGAVLALGTNTPLYGLLYRISGPLLRAVRVPARAIILFHLGLGILAALGLSALLRRFGPRGRIVIAFLFLGAAVVEYAAFPLVVFWTEKRPAPVYRWIAREPTGEALIELPFGLDYDIEYVFRSVAHFRPIVNGYSGFFPPDYDRLKDLFEQRPIPTAVWERIQKSGARLVVYHPHFLVDAREVDYANLLKEARNAGRIAPLATFPHGGRRDFIFEIGGSPKSSAEAEFAAREWDRYVQRAPSQGDRPFGWLDSPKEGAPVSPGDGGLGWALARSGIAEVRLTTGEGATGEVRYGVPHPGVPPVHPGYPDTDRAGFTFRIPALPPGLHQLFFTVIGHNGWSARSASDNAAPSSARTGGGSR